MMGASDLEMINNEGASELRALAHESCLPVVLKRIDDLNAGRF